MHCYCKKSLDDFGSIDGTYDLFLEFNSTLSKA